MGFHVLSRHAQLALIGKRTGFEKLLVWQIQCSGLVDAIFLMAVRTALLAKCDEPFRQLD